MCIRCLLWLLLISVCVCSYECSKRPSTATKSKNDPFDMKLMKHILRQESGNAVLSTFSIELLLNMLYEGTTVNSTTQQELRGPLRRNPVSTEPPRSVNVMQTLADNTDQLVMGNRLFADRMVAVSQKYATILDEWYLASVQNVDFKQPEVAAETINTWVSNTTRGLIPKFFSASDIQNSNLILMNAMYFNGLWASAFSPSYTRTKPFKTASGETVQVPFMRQTKKFLYANSRKLNAELVMMPYVGGKFSMIVVLPNESSSLNELLDSLSPKSFGFAFGSVEEKEVYLELPRFRIDYVCPLKAALQQLGINRIFENNAELGAMVKDETKQVKVSDVVQKTVLIVDEKGTKAATASAVLSLVIGGRRETMFIVNRPFMFFIFEQLTATVVFSGKVENPALGSFE